jgi:hypothetical protein
MRTQLEPDSGFSNFKPKNATLEAETIDGTLIGRVVMNMADFAVPEKYSKTLTLE